MGRGRPHKPQSLKDIEGNRGKGRRPDVPDLPLQGLPECPDTLDAVGAEHFASIVRELGAVGVVKRLDTHALSAAAEVWSDFWHAAEQLRKSEGVSDLAAAKVWRVKKYAALEKWLQFSARIGLTPVDRLKIVGAGAGNKPVADEVEERFLKIRA